jgi:cytochrome bd ubiquinol oxidase subunit I
MNYPIWNISMGGAVLMAFVAVLHVIVSHFAVGGGLVIAATETLAVRRSDWEMRELARRSSLMLILVSTVFGAISGVGIWVVAGLIAPGAISALIHTYVWGWAMEWVFFIVEVVAALVYWATWGKVSRGVHLMIAWIYFVAAYASLVIINGIITFMLTPGRWLETHAFWDGFFNPTYWPDLLLRTGIVLIMASVFMVFPALRGSLDARPRLLRWLGAWLAGGAVLAYGGYRWWEAALGEDTRALFLGPSPLLAPLASTRHIALWALAAVLVLALVLLLALPRLVRPAVAVVLMAVAFTFFAGYERLREGVRKPFLIHGYMFSNGLRIDQIADLNRDGFLAHSGWAATGGSADPVAVGRRIFQAQCASCHTLDGYRGIRRLLPDDPDMVSGVLMALYSMGDTYAGLGPGEKIASGTLDYPFMPPVVGSEEEVEALSRYLVALGSASSSQAARLGGER